MSPVGIARKGAPIVPTTTSALVFARVSAVAVLALLPVSPSTSSDGVPSPPAARSLPESFTRIQVGPAGGTVWQGHIGDPSLPALRRPTVVYLPPPTPARTRLPVLYLLQGFRGSPFQYPNGLRFASMADRMIAAHLTRPFIAVAPPAGLTWRFHGEWTGVWEEYVVRDIVPWVDRHLPTIRARQGRAIAGLSAGGYGAVDIGLRRPELFQTEES
jgi:S-formylglutathione hydrolase FrmB